jgi:hypothetical protein
MSKVVLMIVVVMFVSQPVFAQLELPRPSPESKVKQKVGITEVKVTYSSPGVKGRKIWGELVPFGTVWRTGANEATEVSFSTDVKVNGKELKAGTYSFFTLPGQTEWKVMFNSRTGISGTDYKPETDVLTLNVKPMSGEFRERMAFLIENNTNSSADLVLHWEKLRLVLNLEVNTAEMVMMNAEKEIDGLWSTPFQAANYCLQNDMNLEQGMEWINLSTLLKETYWNMRVKAQLEAKMGKKDAAVKTMTAAIQLGEKMENAPFDFDNMKAMLAKWQGM